MAIAVNPTDVNLPAGDSESSNDDGQAGALTNPIGEVPSAGVSNPDQAGNLPTIPEIFQQPAVRKAFPAIIVVLTIAVFAISYLWMDSGSYRSLYPGMVEADRQASYEALVSADFDAKIDSTIRSTF